MGEYRKEPAFENVIGELRKRLTRLETTQGTPTYTMLTRPNPATVRGVIIFVSDGAAGSKFQGSDGTSWVSLG